MKHLNNKGISLLELILAMALASFVTLGASYMMMNTSKSFAGTNTELSLQSDAQIVMNTVTDRLLEGNNSYFNTTNNTLTIYHTDQNPSTFDKKDIIWLRNSTNKIYIFLVENAVQQTDIQNLIATPTTELDKYLLGDNVVEFRSTQTSVTGTTTGIIDIKLKLTYAGKEYELANNIKLRNKVVAIP